MKVAVKTADRGDVQGQALTLLLLLPGILLADRPRDQYLQLFYRIDLKGQISNDSEGVRGLVPYRRFQERQKDLCMQGQCRFSIHHGMLLDETAGREGSEHDTTTSQIRESRLFDLFVPLPPSPEAILPDPDAYFKNHSLLPGQSRRHRLGEVTVLFYSLADCSHESTALLEQVYRAHADADLFLVFLPPGTCVSLSPPENPYHSLSDPVEQQTARTLMLSPGAGFKFFRDPRGTYRCTVDSPHLANIRLHFRGRQLLGVEASVEDFVDSRRNYPL